MARDRVLALILAGGAGSRMDVLTRERAKPAMPFAGSYRLIDFPLSNLHHSGVDDVWLSVQYQPHSIADEIAGGRPWDLDRTYGGLRILPPQEGIGAVEDGLASGNADVLFRQRDLIRAHAPTEIIVLSADHVYRLDYAEAIATHRDKGADCTVVTSVVSRELAVHHAVITANKSGRVTDLAYKPKRAKTGVVATEIFVYSPEALISALEALHRELPADDDGGSGLGDFGEHLLPYLIEREAVYEHRMSGYWKDVGRPAAFFAAHRDLLAGDVGLLDHPGWPILTRSAQRGPVRLEKGSRVEDSLISPGSQIAGTVRRSVLGPGVCVESGAVVSDSIVLADTRIGAGAKVSWSILDGGVHIGDGARLGGRPKADLPTDEELSLVGKDVQVAPGVVLPRGSRLEPGTTA